MFRYYVWLAARSLKRNSALTALMVLAIGLGIGASITTLTVLRVLSGDPIPDKSAQLFYPQIDPRGLDYYSPGQAPPELMSYPDGMSLLKSRRADKQALMSGGYVIVDPRKNADNAVYVNALYTTSEFFSMFEVPFWAGEGWSSSDDDAHVRDVVISKRLNDEVFGGVSGVGEYLRINNEDFRVVGVINRWRLIPHFYDLETSVYGQGEDIFIPLETAIELKLDRNGSMNCWSDIETAAPEISPGCGWLWLWVELDSLKKAERYEAFLNNYSDGQRNSGRFQRPNNVRLLNVNQWLSYEKVVPSDVHLQVWLALSFLVVCLVNAMGLMLAKFLRRNNEIALRRAIGALRRDIFFQFLVEAVVVGLFGGLIGLLLALLGLWGVRQQSIEYADLIHLDLLMLLLAMLLSMVAVLLSGLLPAWRACQVTPALQLKGD
ncbi:MAG: ABC transporter permease [Solimonas sp.]